MSKPKYSPEQKVEIITAYQTGKICYTQLQKVYGINPDTIYRFTIQE